MYFLKLIQLRSNILAQATTEMTAKNRSYRNLRHYHNEKAFYYHVDIIPSRRQDLIITVTSPHCPLTLDQHSLSMMGYLQLTNWKKSEEKNHQDTDNSSVQPQILGPSFQGYLKK